MKDFQEIDLYAEQVELEREAREASIARLRKEQEAGNFGESLPGSFLVRNYIIPVSDALRVWLAEANGGRPGPNNMAAVHLSQVEPEVAVFIFTKALLTRLTQYRADKLLTVTGLALGAANLIHDELRIRKFELEHKAWFERVWSDFDSRELPRYKREEYLRKVIKDADEDWDIWTKPERLRVGLKLLELFKATTGDVEVVTMHQGKKVVDILRPSPGLIAAIEKLSDSLVDMCAVFSPMVVPPVAWTEETINRGGYLSHHASPYPLVKSSRRAYRAMLRERAGSGELSTVLCALNAIQETPWRINSAVLEVLEYVYERNIECGKLPRADNKEADPPPKSLENLSPDDPAVKEYRRYLAQVHEYNRRVVGKRVMAVRALQTARRFEKYDAIYFPHDLDSRGRAYPKPQLLNPQGPDYVKGLLEFSEGKPLGERGLFWLGVHGANCWGEDKLYIKERAAWARDNLPMIREIAKDPYTDLRWTRADNPVQFLAFCFEYADAHPGYISHLHVDLDATCSGLQHFSGMLLDEVGGFHVNMIPGHPRQDVYGAVAKVAEDILRETRGDRAEMAKAWVASGLMDRKVAKRPVMVKPYAGTRQSCVVYVADAVGEKLAAGAPLPWAKDDMFAFKLMGADAVWNAIPRVVVAADKAMLWLSTMARLVGKSQPAERRIEWTTPAGLPVHQYKFDMVYRRVKTVFDGAIYRPRLAEETDNLDPRKMASSVAPSFVHSMDAAHLQITVRKAVSAGLRHFAMVHDSFGVHAADIDTFAPIIREAFVEMYRDHDVLQEFFESASRLISEENRGEIPPVPKRGRLALEGVLQSEFFFS